MSDPARVESIALEHLAWARQQGFTFGQVLRSIGSTAAPTLDTAVTELAKAWINLPCHSAHPLPKVA